MKITTMKEYLMHENQYKVKIMPVISVNFADYFIKTKEKH